LAVNSWRSMKKRALRAGSRPTKTRPAKTRPAKTRPAKIRLRRSATEPVFA